MRRIPSLLETLHDTFHRSKKHPNEIADELGVSYSYLARAVLEGPSGCNFPLHLLIPLMKATNNYSVLKRLANLCGFMLIKRPRGAKNRRHIHRELNSYQKHFSEMVSQMLLYIERPGLDQGRKVVTLLIKHMEESEWWRQRCVKGKLQQVEMFED